MWNDRWLWIQWRGNVLHSWLPTFAFQSPIMKRTSFWVLVLECLAGLHRTIQLQLLQHYWSGIDLILNDTVILWYQYCDSELFPLEMNKDHSVIFETAFKYCISDSYVEYYGYSISSKGFLPTVVDIMVIWVKFIHSSPFNSLIAKMSTFTLAITSLITSNLPWFLDQTFQVPMQYCSLQHRTLLPSPVKSTTECCFCFGSVSSFFLELFLHWSPVAYWAVTTRAVPLSVSYLLAFSYSSRGSEGRNTDGVCHSLLQWPTFVRTLHHDLSVFGGPTQHGS